MRLIDADALWTNIANNSACYHDCCRAQGEKGVLELIDEAPTIETESARRPVIDLKPCPFCGHKAAFRIMADTAIGKLVKGIDFSIYCPDCGIETPKSHKMQIEFHPETPDGIAVVVDEREEAVAAWNRRKTNETT